MHMCMCTRMHMYMYVLLSSTSTPGCSYHEQADAFALFVDRFNREIAAAGEPLLLSNMLPALSLEALHPFCVTQAASFLMAGGSCFAWQTEQLCYAAGGYFMGVGTRAHRGKSATVAVAQDGRIGKWHAGT